MNRRALFLLCLFLFGSIACGGGESSATAQSTDGAEAPADATTPPAAPVPDELPVVTARVGDSEITRADLERALSVAAGRFGGEIPSEQRDATVRGTLDQLIGFELLTQQAAIVGIVIDDADIDERFAAIRQRYPTEEQVSEFLAQQGLTLDQARAETRQTMAVQRLVEREITPNVVVTPDDMQSYYDTHPDEFTRSESVRARHILIRVEEGADDAARQLARTKIDGLLEEVRGGGDFAALAQEHSADPGSGAKGGDLGFFGRGQMVPPFDQAAFSTPVGAVSDVVETRFGYHIIRVEEKRDAELMPLDDQIRGRLEAFLKQRKQQDAVAAYVEKLKESITVEVLI